MAYDDIIDPKQGSIKSSEIFLDRSLDIIKNSIGETLLKTLEGMMKPVSDALRYNNFLLHSDGQIVWETNLGQPRIRFNADSKANNIRLRLMMLDESAQSRTVDVIIPATTGANSLTAFNTIDMNNNDLIYMELSRSVILTAISGTPATTPATILLENGIDGGSVTSGRRLLKVSTTGNTGMPAMVADLDSILQDASQTVNIPIASRYDWTDGISTYSDIWWIPHGIRWPTGSISVVGAIVVSGFNALPNYFVRTETELTQALTLLTNDGGIVTPIASFTINNPVTVPANTTIYGRSNRGDGIGNAKITLGTTAGFTLQTGASLKNLGLVIPSGFGAAGVSYAVTMSGDGSSVEECEFYLQSTTVSPNLTNTRCVRVNAQKCTVIRSKFFNLTTAGATGIYVQNGSNHLFVQNRVTNVVEIGYATVASSVSVKSDYGMVPVGSIIPWLGASYLNTSNGSPVYLVGGSGVANLASYLGEGWVICDGSALPTDSPLRTGGNIYTPNLTNQYIRGASTFGSVLGNNAYNINGATAIFNADPAITNPSYNVAMNAISLTHKHDMRHTHEWGYYQTNSALQVLTEADWNVSNWTTTPPVNSINLMNFPYKTGSSNSFGSFTQTGYASKLYTGGPLLNGTQGSPPGLSQFTGNSLSNITPTGTVNLASSGSVSAASLNNSQGNHSHSLSPSQVLPQYISVIFIMRVK